HVGHIRTSDQQDKCDSTHQQQRVLARDIAGHGLREGHRAKFPAFVVFGISLGFALGDGLHLRGSLGERDARLQTAEHPKPPAVPTLAFLSVNGQGDPSFGRDRKSTRLNSSHVSISYAVFCLKKKKKNNTPTPPKLLNTYKCH